ncbi:alpha/beta hydrolase [Amycolatopsis rhabdoformis]|uniref:Alpha/beta hydrolase n=1 Tax=Amycolatopsis rhabdoformis TaxID=1448059 RepID=A0ABZ1I4E9_9PSEU|nr:alpha/beta hydrolase [Amycolatopsis rhabdoformis]WSE28728.1 alpha/beta hydrolase [Amycolatopsis rhabdoformis]
MAMFLLIHGGGGSGWEWHLVAEQLRARGHEAVAPDLPIEDPASKFADLADAAVSAVGDASDVVVVGHSYGGFTAPIAARRLDARLLVFVAGMVPAPGEAPAQWWGNVGYENPGEGLSVTEQYLADVPPELAEESLRRGRDQASAEYNEPWPEPGLPDLPTRALLCRDDRFFSPALQRRLVRDRLGLEADEIDGSHCVALSRPAELAERLDRYFATL